MAKKIVAQNEAGMDGLSPAGQKLWGRLEKAGTRGVPLGEIEIETLAELQIKRPEQYKMLRYIYYESR
ncbi:MAG: hypothetical protein JW934_02380 [Anaerolineae bacterium]|nr:hypothetical protein [Anaerolineae bacterium]